MWSVKSFIVLLDPQVGSDINAMSAQPWRQPQLAFVPGLGPSKADSLLRALALDKHITDRMDLKAPSELQAGDARRCALLGPRVFRNAAPFNRVRSGGVPELSDVQFGVDIRMAEDAQPLLKALVDAALPEAAGRLTPAIIEEGRQRLEQVGRLGCGSCLWMS